MKNLKAMMNGSGGIKNQRGFTLIELMVSIAIITLVTMASVYTLTYAHYLSEESRGRLLALNAARSTLEEIKETAMAGVTAIDTSGFIPADLPNGTITITSNPGANIATVTVQVQWTGPRGRAMNLEVTTMRSAF